MIFINTWWVGGHEPIRLSDISKFKIHRYSFDPRFLKEYTQEKIEVKIFFRELLQNTLWWHFKSFNFSVTLKALLLLFAGQKKDWLPISTIL